MRWSSAASLTHTSRSRAKVTASGRPRIRSARSRRTRRSSRRCSASTSPMRSSPSRSRISTTLPPDLTRHAVDVLPEGELERKLKLGRPLRVKLGIDPTAPDIHLGFAFVLDRLAAFQRAGHTVVLIVGDYTARIGDPSGRSDERPVLPDEVLDANAKEFAEQAFRVLDRERTEIRFNGEWLGKLSYAEVVRLARTITVARILERDDFAKRFAAHEPISIPDAALPQWWELVVDGGEHPDDPMQWKLELARRIVARWHGDEGARRGEEHFTRVVREHQAPADVPEVSVSEPQIHLPAFLAQQLGDSSSHWRRVIDQGGVKIDGRPVDGYDLELAEAEGRVLQAGRRHFMRLTQR